MENAPSKPSNLRTLLSLGAFVLLGVIAVLIIPRIDHTLNPAGVVPSMITFLGVGGVLSLLTAVFLYVSVKKQLPLLKKFLVYAILYNILIVIVKFFLGPLGFYAAGATFDITLFTISPSAILWLTAGIALGLYLLVFYILYGRARKRAAGLPESSLRKKEWFKIILLSILVAVLVLISGMLPPTQYLVQVLFGSTGILIFISLIAAVFLARKALFSAADQGKFIRDVALLTLAFSVGAMFLAAYHALWLVYMLALASIWPISVVVPK